MNPHGIVAGGADGDHLADLLSAYPDNRNLIK